MKKYLSLFFLSMILFTSCSADDDGYSGDFDGTMASISDFVGSDLLTVMTDLGLVLYPGENPPVIEGDYLVSPTVLENSTIETDSIGRLFPDHSMTFYDQKNLRLKFSARGGIQNDTGAGAFISGSGNTISVFLVIRSEVNGLPVDGIYVISGRLEEEGIYDFQNAAFMKDNHGNPGGVFMENGEGRIFADGDGLVERL